MKLKFTASGVWWVAPDRQCGPDGIRDVGFGDALLVSSAALGALVAKIGGSNAEKPDATKQTVVFVVGPACILSLDEKIKGPLFLTMNDSPLRFTAHRKELDVQIWEAS